MTIYFKSNPAAVPGQITSSYMDAQGVADFNGDGISDLIGGFVVFAQFVRSPLVLLASNGQGGFADATQTLIDGPIPAPYQARQMVVADFNRDGRPDIYIACTGVDLASTASVGEPNILLLSQPNGHLRDVSATNLPAVSDFSHSTSVGDINRDGSPDIFVGNFLTQGTFKSSYFLINDGTGRFTQDTADVPAGLQDPRTSFQIGTSALVDLNRDGNIDLLVGNHGAGNASRVYWGNGTASFTNATFTELPTAPVGGSLGVSPASAVGDLNGDGLPDIILSVDYFSAGRTLQVLINKGNKTFTDVSANLPSAFVQQGNGFYANFELTDMNGDGTLDIVVDNYNGGGAAIPSSVPVMWLNDGRAHFTAIFASDLQPSYSTIGNGAGYPNSFGVINGSDNSHQLLSISWRPDLLVQTAALTKAADGVFRRLKELRIDIHIRNKLVLRVRQGGYRRHLQFEQQPKSQIHRSDDRHHLVHQDRKPLGVPDNEPHPALYRLFQSCPRRAWSGLLGKPIARRHVPRRNCSQLLCAG